MALAFNQVEVLGWALSDAPKSRVKGQRGSYKEDETLKYCERYGSRDDVTINIKPAIAGCQVEVGESKNIQIGDCNKLICFLHSLNLDDGKTVKIYYNQFEKNVIKNNLKMFPSALRRFGTCAGKRYNVIMKCMRECQDNGMFEKMEFLKDWWMETFKKKGEIDLQVVILVQYAIKDIYTDERATLERAEKQLKEALLLAEQAKNHQFLIGKCLIYLAYVYLFKKEIDTALNYLSEAAAVLKLFVSDEDKAMICYIYGHIFILKLSATDTPSEEDEIKALEYFGLDTAHVLESSDHELIAKRTHWSTLRQVKIYFRDYKRNFQSYSVTEENLRKGKDMLDKFEELCWCAASPAVKVYFFSYRADYFGRIGQLQRGLDILEKEGSPMAERVGHNHLIKMMEEKKKVFQTLLRTEKGEDKGTLLESMN